MNGRVRSRDDATRPVEGRVRRSLRPPRAVASWSGDFAVRRCWQDEIRDCQSGVSGGRGGNRVLAPLLRARQHPQALLSALLAFVLWPLLLVGINLHIK